MYNDWLYLEEEREVREMAARVVERRTLARLRGLTARPDGPTALRAGRRRRAGRDPAYGPGEAGSTGASV